jgi:hypothetical protein
MKDKMNADNDNQKPSDTREARTRVAEAEPPEPEAPTAKDPSEYRETSELGYGWGV